MVSSLLLAGMGFHQRLNLASNGSLPSSLALDDHTIALTEAEANVAHLFGIDPIPSRGLTLAQWSGQVLLAWQNAPTPRLTFCTSGSTGQPAPVTHDLSLLAQEVHALSRLFQNHRRLVSHVPRHHIYGFLFTILMPKALNIPVIWCDPMPTPGLVSGLMTGDLVVGFPLFWRTLTESDVRFPKSIAGTTSTGPCPAETIHSLCRQGVTRITEIYGASETSGIGFRHAPDDSYELLEHWLRGQDGHVQRNHPTTGDTLSYSLQDELRWEGDRTFHPLGRRDKAVQVAGINVYPDRVRQVILAHPAVADCAVRLMRPDEGIKLKALIVPKTTGLMSGEDRQRLRLWLSKRLSHYEMPGQISFTENIPMNALGKQQDWHFQQP